MCEGDLNRARDSIHVTIIFLNGTTASTYGATDITDARSGSRSARIALKTSPIERSHFFTSKLYPTFFFNAEKKYFFEINKIHFFKIWGKTTI